MSAKRLILLIGIIAILLIAGWVAVAPKQRSIVSPKGENMVTTTPESTKNHQEEISPTAGKTYPGAVEFTSPTLGIAFYYLPTQNNMQIKVKESGNNVYVYNSTLKAESGQSVAVFEKAPDQSLSDAITKRFLSGKSSKECWVVDTTSQYKSYPSSYKIAEISFPKPTDSQEPWWSLSEKCSFYAQSNGMRYFLEDTKHPGKYVFFDIGQYGIMAGERIPWQDTFRFL